MSEGQHASGPGAHAHARSSLDGGYAPYGCAWGELLGLNSAPQGSTDVWARHRQDLLAPGIRLGSFRR